MKKRMMKICYMMTLAVVLCTSGTIGATGIKSVYAAENEVQGRAATTNGILNLNNGPASITIKGNDGQSLKGKRFLVYQLFQAENAKGMESINYTFNPEYKKFVCYIVGQRIHKDERNVTEYDVIDYIQSLNTHQTEGAQTAQEKEGVYSEYRVFVEELRTHLQRNGKIGQSVEVTSTKADNSFEIKGLAYGYYIIDEVTAVKGTNSAASLCMVSTANPEMNLNIKSDYPVVTKKIREDDEQDKVGNQGWNDLADFEIGQTVPYRYESNMPDVNGYNNYYYAWHDVMSEALTFKKDSVAIRIYENSNAGNYYELKEDEFEVKKLREEEIRFRLLFLI